MGNTSLQASIAKGNMSLVKLLLKKDADVGAIDTLNRSALQGFRKRLSPYCQASNHYWRPDSSS
jgi:hypothetical protein